MIRISPSLDDKCDLPGLARDSIKIHLKKVLAGNGVAKVPRLAGSMNTTFGMNSHLMHDLFVKLAGIKVFETPIA